MAFRSTDYADQLRLLRAFAEYAHTIYPGFKGARFQIDLAGGEIANIPIPPELLHFANGQPRDTDEFKVIEVLSGLDKGQTLVGEEIAASAGVAFNGRFRQLLARMVKDQIIEQRRPGYCMPQ